MYQDLDTATLQMFKKAVKMECSPKGKVESLVPWLQAGVQAVQNRTQKLKFNRNVFLITDGETPLARDAKELKEFDTMRQFEFAPANVTIIIVDFDRMASERARQKCNTKTMDMQEAMNKVAIKHDWSVLTLSAAKEVYGDYFVKVPIRQTKVYSGDLELSSLVKFKVQSFNKTDATSIPTRGQESILAKNRPDVSGDCKVTRVPAYFSNSNMEEELDPIALSNAHRYGSQLVPWAKEGEETMVFKPEKGLKIIGFVNSVPEHIRMSKVECVQAVPGKEQSEQGFAAMVRAMRATGLMAIARYVPRKDMKVVVLEPGVEDGVDILYLNVLPFEEDERHYTFSDLDTDSLRPSKEQIEATDKVVEKLALNDNEFLPEKTYNPTYQKFFRLLHARAVCPEKEVIVDDDLRLTPLKRNFDSAEEEIEMVKKAFPLKVDSKQVVKQEKQLFNLQTATDANKPIEEDTSTLDVGRIADDEVQVQKVGSATPVDDFWALLRRRDEDKTTLAIKGMIDQINAGGRGDTMWFKRALGCLKALREGCLQNDAVAEFNKFMEELKHDMAMKNFFAFLKSDREKGGPVSLIHEEESSASEVTREEARKFLESEVKREDAGMVQKDIEQDPTDDVLDDLDL